MNTDNKLISEVETVNDPGNDLEFEVSEVRNGGSRTTNWYFI